MSKSDIALSVRNVSKQYVIAQEEKHYTLAEKVLDRVRHPFRSAATETFHALKDVSFDVKKGEVVGIIGRNGAGKSTLLKILSRITEPTSGKIDLYGRVGSLLEVGTGFHPELTGRENIFLNGAILGMKRSEIQRQFDAIVDFAEVEKFLDTPVKRYSSGMYVRLAFAVAAHLNPEILIVDEVLAVGDAEFQKKCLGKMKEVSRSGGRTVLFVSHNMVAMEGLCSTALLFTSGQLSRTGIPSGVIREYQSQCRSKSPEGQSGIHLHRGMRIAIERTELVVEGSPTASVQSGDSCSIRVYYRLLDERAVGTKLSVSLLLYDDGKKIANLWTNYACGEGLAVSLSGCFICHIPRWPFRSHMARVDIYTHFGHEVEDYIEGCLYFESHDGDYYGSGVITNPGQGIVLLEHNWTHNTIVRDDRCAKISNEIGVQRNEWN